VVARDQSIVSLLPSEGSDRRVRLLERPRPGLTAELEVLAVPLGRPGSVQACNQVVGLVEAVARLWGRAKAWYSSRSRARSR
jgi:hypothetical protein